MATLYYTSDMHSYLYPTDYIQGERANTGYFSLSRHFDPNCLVVDGGDVLQGSPLARQVYKDGFVDFPQAEAMNAAGVKVFVPGNHDFNFGYDVFKQFVRHLDAQLVCANLRDVQGNLAVAPWYIHVGDDGVRVGVVGVVTDYVNIWEDRENLGPLQILDCVEEASSALKALGEQAVDYTVCVYHGGFEDSHARTSYRENRANELAALGFDVLLTAHQHTKVEPYYFGNCLSMQCMSNALYYGKVQLEKTRIRASLHHCGEGEIFPNSTVSAVAEKYLPLQRKILLSLDREIGRTQVAFTDEGKLESAVHGSFLADFFNQIQLDHSGADISCVSLFNHPRSLGPVVKAGDVLAAYPFPNTLVVLEVSGWVLKEALERCASYFMVVDGEIQISKEFLVPKVEHYNYDYYQNLAYGFAIGNPLGQRVVELSYKGEDLLMHPEKTLTLVMNNYRATGTGGYEVFLDCPVIRHEKTEVQELLFAAFSEERVIPVPPSSSFFVRL